MDAILRDLNDPAAFPDKSTRVRMLQTHASYVFLTDSHAYKVKKPVNFGFLDFSTLEKRKYFCEQEVLLNQRLAKDIYVGVVPLTYDGKRHVVDGRAGEIKEYAVMMKRIPDGVVMRSVFEQGNLTDQHLLKIAEVLSGFHSTAAHGPHIDPHGLPEHVKINTEENLLSIEKYVGMTMAPDDFEALRKWTSAFLAKNQMVFLKRIREGKIRDCHGDLHMEHICFTRPLSIIDCIEFNERLRYGDTVADMAFLLMDLEYHGGIDEARLLWETYEKKTGEKEDVNRLVTFYKVYRALVRGKVNSLQLDDADIGAGEKETAAQTARNYFRLAVSYLGFV